MELILKYITRNKALKKLNISWNGLSGLNYGFLLYTILLQCPDLIHIDVSHNLLESENLISMSEALYRPKKLEVIKMGFNKLSSEDALNILYNYKKKTVRCNLLDLGRVCVTPAFMEILNQMKYIPFRETAKVIHGEIIGNYTILGPNMKELLIKRCQFLGLSKKKTPINFGVYMLKLRSSTKQQITIDNFCTKVLTDVGLNDDLLKDLSKTFAIAKKYIDIDAIIEIVLKLWPDIELPYEPPPVEKAPPIEEKQKPKGKKEKGKKKK